MPTKPTPPTFRIKLLHERKSGQYRKIDGRSGLRYVFAWDDAARHYTYDPKTEAEVEDIFSTIGRLGSAIFAPLSREVEAAAVPVVAPPPAPKPTPEQVTHSVAILTEADARGIEIREGDTDELLARLVQVHDFALAKGQAPAPVLESEAQEGLDAAPEATPEPEAPSDSRPAQGARAPFPKGKPGRKPKNHSAGEPDNDATG